MNDNLMRHVLRQADRDQSRADWLQKVHDARGIGIRAITRPESLTMGEIQDIAWGFLMAADTLEAMVQARE